MKNILKNKIAKIKFQNLNNFKQVVVPLGIPEIDRLLPLNGLQSAKVHEIIGDEIDCSALGFSAALLYLFINYSKTKNSTVLWCNQGAELYAPGIVPFGIDEDQLLLIRSYNNKDVLWAMEEGLRSGVLAAVLGEIIDINATEVRRLHLASRVGNIPAFILRKKSNYFFDYAVATRWKVSALSTVYNYSEANKFQNKIYWKLELMRCQNGMTGNWDVEWAYNENKIYSDKKKRGFNLVSKL